MSIRKLTSDDLAAFRDIRLDMCREHPEAFGQTPEEVTETPDEKLREWIGPSHDFPQMFILGFFEEERLLATAAFKREDSAKERHRGWIWGVYVSPEARGRSIARQLMVELIKEARKIEGVELLYLTVALTQTGARTLYTSLGFFTTGLIVHGLKLSDGRYVDLEEMILHL